ncbi:hypothetical protein LSH36_776g02155 [Paralvinella palmiformis]|uniref:Uncharacterized protein n=1 Tax=Paralvinella palmiformis TaxID=53620 RepID=A0AAD9MV77_9ANNE|nr:hypothetical protein LSH36_776g02155 [Paralvinella palmiformis]
MSDAKFGRMKFTECSVVEDFIGCENDVSFLLDQWCSGHRTCHIIIPNKELTHANTACLPYLSMYLEVEYSCLKEAFILKDNEGVISSYATVETGCGSSHSPWIISGTPGQTIELYIIDFGSERFKINNKTKSGCPDLSPPAHAWYKRNGDQAVIGCEWSQKTWHLSCDGRSWSGVVGNCSDIVTQQPADVKKEVGDSPAALWLVCVVSVSVVLMVIACVVGIVCMKKYR